MLALAILVGAYLLGSFPTGPILARRAGVDLGKVGSGNVGATNVARALGWRVGALTLAVDLGKGFAAAFIARSLAEDARIVAAAGLAAVLGHLFPPWLKFKGGKGVATSLGVLLALAPAAALAGAATWGILVAKTRISSVGSLAGAGVAAIVTPLVTSERATWVLGALLFLCIALRHADNLRRLLRGEENEI